jgi:hypothetical protein
VKEYFLILDSSRDEAMRAIFFLFSVFLVSACTTVREVPSEYKKGSFPGIGDRVTVSVGSVMVSEYNYLANEQAVILSSIDGSFWAGRAGIMSGTSLVKAYAGNVELFCQPPGSYGNPCLADTNRDGSFDHAYTMNAFGAAVNKRKIEPAPYRLSDASMQDGFKYELIYQGIDESVARIAYREYSDNLARPAYRQDLSYTLEDRDTQVKFRDVSLTIHNADNNEIDYTVHSGF